MRLADFVREATGCAGHAGNEGRGGVGRGVGGGHYGGPVDHEPQHKVVGGKLIFAAITSDLGAHQPPRQFRLQSSCRCHVLPHFL